jgi:hypothetical protein
LVERLADWLVERLADWLVERFDLNCCEAVYPNLRICQAASRNYFAFVRSAVRGSGGEVHLNCCEAVYPNLRTSQEENEVR